MSVICPASPSGVSHAAVRAGFWTAVAHPAKTIAMTSPTRAILLSSERRIAILPCSREPSGWRSKARCRMFDSVQSPGLKAPGRLSHAPGDGPESGATYEPLTLIVSLSKGGIPAAVALPRTGSVRRFAIPRERHSGQRPYALMAKVTFMPYSSSSCPGTIETSATEIPRSLRSFSLKEFA